MISTHWKNRESYKVGKLRPEGRVLRNRQKGSVAIARDSNQQGHYDRLSCDTPPNFHTPPQTKGHSHSTTGSKYKELGRT